MGTETWLVTGHTGFIGRHILAELERDASEPRRVVGLSRTASSGHMAADLQIPSEIQSALKDVGPDVVIHAAGSTRDEDCLETNVLGTINLLTGLASLHRPTTVVLLGSAAELGPVPTECLPVGPDYEPQPTSNYGRTKLAATLAGLSRKEELDVRVARVFNPVGPGMPRSQAFGRFAQLLKSNPEQDPLVLDVGNLEPRRDFIDVRDVASAVIALAKGGRPGEIYHVGTGVSHSVREGLEHLIAFSRRDVKVEPRHDQVAGSGPADSRADNTSLREQTGWAPRIGFVQSLRDLWETE